MKKITAIVTSVIICMGLANAKEFITIGTGGMTGTYYPVGGAICRIVNLDKNMKCSVQSTGASVYNVNAVLKKELNFGFVQSDVVYDKYNGVGKFKDSKDENLRAVIAIYPELLAFVTSAESGIKEYKDAIGKNINIGNPGSGNEFTSLIVFNEYGIKESDFSYRGVLTAQECPMALKDKKIQGYFYMVGHPTANITDAANSLKINLVSIGDKESDEIIKKYPYYSKGIIPAGYYEGVDYDTKTIGVKAVLVADKSQSDSSVRAVVKAILDHFDEYKNLHPALKSVTKESLIDGLSAPLHPAAEAVYKEYGLIK